MNKKVSKIITQFNDLSQNFKYKSRHSRGINSINLAKFSQGPFLILAAVCLWIFETVLLLSGFGGLPSYQMLWRNFMLTKEYPQECLKFLNRTFLLSLCWIMSILRLKLSSVRWCLCTLVLLCSFFERWKASTNKTSFTKV